MRRVQASIAALAIATATSAVGTSPVWAQATLNERIAARAQTGSGSDRLLVDARELVYDNDRNTVSAVGDVQLNYQGRTLQADRVTYDRKSGRVYAEGNARLTDASGAVVTGSRFELTEDFRNGFIDSLRVAQTTVEEGTAVTSRFSAPRAERVNGDTTVFERGTYTACEPCAKNPERPPLWQVKAARIIHNDTERTVYFEDASLEFLGVPIARVPYFWTPDPTVQRKSGLLAPRYVASNTLGVGVSVPLFWAIAPNYDLTITPTFLTRQGVLGEAEWRHRLIDGSYNVRAAGILQQDSGAFLPSPRGPGDRDARGSLESKGLFYINERWKWGWDVTLLSDKWFPSNYNLTEQSLSSLYFKDSVSTLFLQGKGDRSWFDLRSYYFQGLSSYDFQKHQPVVHPVLDYNRRFDGPAMLGGEIGVDLNITSLTRQTAQYEEIPRQVTKLMGLYDTCAVFDRSTCIVRGISGTTSRASAEVSWRRRYIDPVGQAWTPFAYARADGFWVDADFAGSQNQHLANFLPGEQETAGRLMPAVGLDYRYPLLARTGGTMTHVVEPIAQVIVRPNETRAGRLPNEDAQSLIFDDTSLFDWDKFSGYDRVEGGVRANLGAQYTMTAANGFYANALFGQSIQLAGLNSFERGDIANVGRDSGLESTASDYVGRFQVSPNRNLSFVARGRFDQQSFAAKRIEAGISGTFSPWLPVSASLLYANYAAQPELGYQARREGLAATAQVNLNANWYLSGSVLVDLDRFLINRSLDPAPGTKYGSKDGFSVSAMSLGIGYMDECTVFSINYVVAPQDLTVTSGERDANQSLLFRLELRTLGQASYRQSIGTAIAEDGIADR
jgi:LPS-assembly protein